IPEVPASPLVANAIVSEFEAFTRTIGETVITVIITSARLNVDERRRRGFWIFSDSVKTYFQQTPEPSESLFCTFTIAHMKSQLQLFLEYYDSGITGCWFFDAENRSPPSQACAGYDNGACHDCLDCR